MSIYAFAEIENGVAKRIYASTRYPSRQSGNIFFDSDFTIDLKHADELPLKIEGFYSVVAFRPSHVLVSRDILGGKPLYCNPFDLTFSSFKYYFDEKPMEVLPGEVIKIDYSGEVIDRKVYHFHDVFKKMDASLDELTEIIEKSLLSFKPKYACISFSGGLDSSFLASLYDLQLVTVTASSEEKEWVERAAKMLGRDLEVLTFNENDVKEALPKVVSAIETTDPLQVSIAIPIYLSLKFAKELGYDQVVFGQGADELFGGYKKYETMDPATLENELIDDVKNIGNDNLVRDNKVAYSLEMKIITPYLQWDIVRAAISIPVDMKVRKVDGNIVRKFVLRQIASKYMPKELAFRDKKAVQYSTRTSHILKKIAKSEGMRLEEYLKKLAEERHESAKEF
jgi:asparagine synthase (glutamine-hydrolysing)